MTIFTTNPFDDGYFVDGKPVSKFQQFCMRSWERMESRRRSMIPISKIL